MSKLFKIVLSATSIVLTACSTVERQDDDVQPPVMKMCEAHTCVYAFDSYLLFPPNLIAKLRPGDERFVLDNLHAPDVEWLVDPSPRYIVAIERVKDDKGTDSDGTLAGTNSHCFGFNQTIYKFDSGDYFSYVFVMNNGQTSVTLTQQGMPDVAKILQLFLRKTPEEQQCIDNLINQQLMPKRGRQTESAVFKQGWKR